MRVNNLAALGFFAMILLLCWSFMGLGGHAICRERAEGVVDDGRKMVEYLGVTMPKNFEAARAVDQTWGKGQGIVWFSEEQTDAVGNMVVVEDPTYIQAFQQGEKEGYKHMTFKMLWVWDYAYQNLKAKWYVRHWEDNFVFPKAIEKECSLYDHRQPIIIGTRHRLYDFDFPDGGSTWIVSQGALDLWGPDINKCTSGIIGEKKARELLGPIDVDPERKKWATCKDLENPGVWCAEDVYLWYCLKEAGVRFVVFQGSSQHEAVGQVVPEMFLRSVTGKDLQWKNHYLAFHKVNKDQMRWYGERMEKRKWP